MAKEDPLIEKESFDGSKVKILGETYEAGEQEKMSPAKWRSKLKDRKQMMSYLKTAMRYWYDSEGYGSEKRKRPA